MKTILPLFVAILLASLFFPASAAADAERSVKTVRFAKGKTSTTLKGRIQGYHFIDYRLRGGAGQRLKANLKASNGANYFNMLPAGTTNYAMFIGSISGEDFDGLLPDDGVYTLRVYLMRAAARRNEKSDFTLSIALDGQALAPLPARVDAIVPGTRFHARGTTSCAPSYTRTRACRAGVIRRGHDGTATVVLQWDQQSRRSILFIKGEPVTADVPQAMNYTRNERNDYVIVFDEREHFEIPRALVFGG